MMSLKISLGLSIIMTPLVWATEPEPAREPLLPSNQTVIEDRIEPVNDAQFDYFTDSDSHKTPHDASLLFHIPGLTLTEEGGPLGNSDIRYRGLSQARLRVDLEGLNLINPVNGFSDANAMFLFAASRMQATAQSLSISLPRFSEPYAKGVFGVGSQASLKAGASVGMPLDKYSSIFYAMQLASTNGKYAFSSPYLKKNDPNNNYYRANNDQHRMQGLLNYQRESPTGSAHTLLAFTLHEGGVAGFASTPSPNLRSQTVFSGMSLGASKKLSNVEFYFNAANSLFNYQTSDIPRHDENMMSSTHELTLGLKPIKFFKDMEFDLAHLIIVERAYELNKTRIGSGFMMKRVNRLKGRMKPTIFANFTMIGYQDHGLIFKKDLGFSFEPHQKLSMTARFARSQRLPTFLELYANNRFFVGNPNLSKESIIDLELAATYKINDKAHVHLSSFFGFLSDTIVYVPLLLSKQYPMNTKQAKRFGIDMNLSYEPFVWLNFESNNSVLYTNVKTYDAPLPQAPPFLGFSKLRFGTEDFLNLSLLARYRGPTTANLNGTLKTESYAIIDAIFSARVFKKVTTSFSVSNIFNVKTARDTYEMPLPGTIFYGQVELENM